MSSNGGPVTVTPEVYAGLEYVRTCSDVNLRKPMQAAACALEAGYMSTYNWILANKRQYMEGIVRDFTYEGRK